MTSNKKSLVSDRFLHFVLVTWHFQMLAYCHKSKWQTANWKYAVSLEWNEMAPKFQRLPLSKGGSVPSSPNSRGVWTPSSMTSIWFENWGIINWQWHGPVRPSPKWGEWTGPKSGVVTPTSLQDWRRCPSYPHNVMPMPTGYSHILPQVQNYAEQVVWVIRLWRISHAVQFVMFAGFKPPFLLDLHEFSRSVTFDP